MKYHLKIVFFLKKMEKKYQIDLYNFKLQSRIYKYISNGVKFVNAKQNLKNFTKKKINSKLILSLKTRLTSLINI